MEQIPVSWQSAHRWLTVFLQIEAGSQIQAR